MVGRLLTALALLTVTAAAAAPPQHVSWTRAALERLPQTAEDRVSESRPVELDALAASIAEASRNAPRAPQEWTALLLAVGSNETNFAGRLLRGECRLERHECDSVKLKDGTWFARARGWGQVHRNTRNAALWDSAETDIAAQTKLVDKQLRMAYWTCARSGVPWLRATLNAYAGRMCGAAWRGLAAREATYALAVSR